jgi:hypothetical protein
VLNRNPLDLLDLVASVPWWRPFPGRGHNFRVAANSKFTSSSGKPPSWDTKSPYSRQPENEFLRSRTTNLIRTCRSWP